MGGNVDTFDFVIVGAGTSGCILADRLTSSGRHSVLLLEAGEEPSSMWISIPAGFTKLLTSSRFNWRFQTEPEANTHHRTIPISRGKGLGGSSSINGMIYVRGQPQDYDAWQTTGAEGWSFASLEPYFRQLENYDKGGEGRGTKGPLHIEQVRQRFALSDAFLNAAVQAGYRLNDDYNGVEQEGFGYYQVNQLKGRRWSPYDAFLQPARRRPNLTVRTNAQVLRLKLDDKTCNGVTYVHNGVTKTAKANVEVILAAGAVQSPQILELSGIGAPQVLNRANVELRHSLPGVGENYFDHYIPRMNWRVKNTRTLNEMSRGWRLGLGIGEYYLKGTGLLTLATGLVYGFIKTHPGGVTPDVQFFFVNASYANAGVRTLDTLPGMTVGVMPLRPESKGSIHIKTNDLTDGPSIRPNFLSTHADQKCIVAGMKAAREILQQPAMRNFVDYEINPGDKVHSDDEWLDFARQNGQTGSHPLGTCRMGNDERAVVDGQLRVRGISGLRIVDASVIPQMVSGNIHAAVMVVALRGADLILDNVAHARHVS